MGEYSLSFTADEIIVDGHVFVKPKLPGIYKCTDKYFVYGSDWMRDERNKDLRILVERIGAG